MLFSEGKQRRSGSGGSRGLGGVTGRSRGRGVGELEEGETEVGCMENKRTKQTTNNKKQETSVFKISRIKYHQRNSLVRT